MEIKTTTPICSIEPKTAMFLRTYVGTAEDEGKVYDLSQSPNGAPMIRSKQTGKFAVFNWQALIELALLHGIDVEDPAPAEAKGVDPEEE